MNNALLDVIQEADGRYLNDIELRPFDDVIDAFQTRINAYNTIRDHGKELVLNSLKRMMQTPHRAVIQEHGARCQRDMLYTLEYICQKGCSCTTKTALWKSIWSGCRTLCAPSIARMPAWCLTSC